MGQGIRILVCLFLLSLFTTPSFCSDNPPSPPFSKGGRGGFVSSEISQKVNPQLTKTHVQKLNRIAKIISSEIIKRDIKTVKVVDFTDFKGKPSATGEKMSDEFSRQLGIFGKTNFSIVNNGADVIVTGTLIPFKEGGKWRLDIKVISSSTGKIITSYAGIFKKLKGVRR
ncbi:MAG: hypothetical protein FJ241_10780 [Nitrospira sp.]|nr:hypothetical protein [Nitrospira sp.]